MVGIKAAVHKRRWLGENVNVLLGLAKIIANVSVLEYSVSHSLYGVVTDNGRKTL